MKKFIFIIIFALCYNFIYGQGKLKWENSTDGLEGYWSLNLLELEGDIYETRYQYYSNDTAKSWISNMPNIMISPDNLSQRYHQFTTLLKYKGRYLSFGGRTLYSYDKINWYPRERFTGIPDNHRTLSRHSTDSSILIRMENRQTNPQYKYKTFITKDSIDYNNVTEYNFVPVETDFDWIDRIIEVSPINELLYATTDTPLAFGVYYTSSDGGMNWLKDTIPNVEERIRYIRHFNGRFYIITHLGIWYKDDNGIWIRCESEEFLVDMERTYLVNYEDKIITHSKINNENILVSSSDGGVTWERLGDSNFFIRQLFLMGNTLIANTLLGIRTSTDGGLSWVESNKGLFIQGARWFSSRLQFVAKGNEVLTATRNSMKTNIVMKSYDKGETWEELRLSPDFTEPKEHSSTENWFSVIDTKWGILAVNGIGQAYKTEDFGKTWILYSHSSGGVFLSPENLYERNDTLFYYFNNRIYYSTTKGSAFEVTDIAYRDNLPNNSWHWAIIHGYHFALNSNYELYQSADDGRNWSFVRKFDFEGIAGGSRILFMEGNRIYFSESTTPIEVYVTEDMGMKWEKFKMPPRNDRPEQWIKHNGVYYLLYKNESGLVSSLYSSSNNGYTWELASEGLGAKYINMIHSAGDYIYASTRSGLYRAFSPGPVNVTEEEETIFPIEIYPIPAKDIIKIKHNYYNLKQVKVYDINGREFEIQDFSNDYFATTNLLPGVYIANLIFEGNWSVSKKFIVE